jgi:hypothetical protein
MAPPPAERPEPREAQLIAEIIASMRAQLERDYPPPETRRDAHPKHTGLLEAQFTVEAGLPAELRVGLFSEPRTYRAWVRCSSASGKPQPDSVPDVRGFAIKVLEVAGEKIPESDEPRSQDFVVLSMARMPLGTVRLFRDAIVLSARSPLLFLAKMILTGHGPVLKALKASRLLPTSPLDIRYWSTTPYRFGEGQVVKYSLLPQPHPPAATPAARGDTYLSDAMETQLAGGSVSFDFAVQLRKEGMPIEDAAPLWDEAVSPFRKVATLTIPRQTFRTPERDRLSEQLSFSPGHARVEHRPLGSINRARMQVYGANSDFRHARAGLPKVTG